MSEGHGRYLRHNLIDWFSQSEISASKIAVVGAGAIGNEVVKNLALLGVGQVDVFDFDRVELHNLTRSILLREADVGQLKAQALVERAREIDPNCRLRAISADIRDCLHPLEVRNYRAVVGAVDNFEARLRLNQLCLLAGVDFVNAAIDSRFVSMELFAHSRWDVACYECHLPESAYQRMAQRYSCGGLRKRAFDEKKVATTAITASLSGAMAAAAALRMGASQSSPPDSKRVFLDSHSLQSQASQLQRQPDCPACAGLHARPAIVTRAQFDKMLLASCDSDDWTLVLPEPIIAGLTCQQCGAQPADTAIGRRARDFDDQLAWCPNCQAASVNVELRDRFTASEMPLVTHGGSLPTPHLLAQHGATIWAVVR